MFQCGSQFATKILYIFFAKIGCDNDKLAETTSVVEVVLFGLHLIIPLINQELMRVMIFFFFKV